MKWARSRPYGNDNLIAKPGHEEIAAKLSDKLFAILEQTGGMQIPLSEDEGFRAQSRSPNANLDALRSELLSDRVIGLAHARHDAVRRHPFQQFADDYAPEFAGRAGEEQTEGFHPPYLALVPVRPHPTV